MNSRNKLAEMPIRPLLYTMAVPLMLSLLVQSLYNIVEQYLSINLVYCWGIFLQTYGQRLLQAIGDTVLSMFSLIIGAVLNIILDPIMIFGLLGCPAMWIRGAAIATVIGQIAGAIAEPLYKILSLPIGILIP